MVEGIDAYVQVGHGFHIYSGQFNLTKLEAGYLPWFERIIQQVTFYTIMKLLCQIKNYCAECEVNGIRAHNNSCVKADIQRKLLS